MNINPNHNPMDTVKPIHPDTKDAMDFANSARGQLIMSQALCVAIKTMNEVSPTHLKESSNIKDMEYLRDELFPVFKVFLSQ